MTQNGADKLDVTIHWKRVGFPHIVLGWKETWGCWEVISELVKLEKIGMGMWFGDI